MGAARWPHRTPPRRPTHPQALGTASGAAAALAAQRGCAVQDVPIALLQAALGGATQCFHWRDGACATSCA